MNRDKTDLVNVDRRRTTRWNDKRDLGDGKTKRARRRERERERALANNGEKSITIHGRGNARLYCDLKLP